MREATEDFTFPLKAFGDRIFYFLALIVRHTKEELKIPFFDTSVEINMTIEKDYLASIFLLSLYDLFSSVIWCFCLTNVHCGLHAHLSSFEMVFHVEKMKRYVLDGDGTHTSQRCLF